jgi:hypothetical protein
MELSVRSSGFGFQNFKRTTKPSGLSSIPEIGIPTTVRTPFFVTTGKPAQSEERAGLLRRGYFLAGDFVADAFLSVAN